MKLNANDFRKSLDAKRKEKKQSDESFLRMQHALQVSADRRNNYLTKLSSIALDAALNGQLEIGLDEEEPTEYMKDLQNFGFVLDEREEEVDSLLKKVHKISPADLDKLERRLHDNLTNIVKFADPKVDSDLFKSYIKYVNADYLDFKVRHLLKIIGLYNTAYHESTYWSLDVEDRLWFYLSRLQDVIDFFEPNDTSENYVQTFLSWEDESVDIEDIASADSSYSMLNPNKLRFINTDKGQLFFSNISEEMTEQTENLKSCIEFELKINKNESYALLTNEIKHTIPFGTKDLQVIFENMKFKTTFKPSINKLENTYKFKVKF